MITATATLTGTITATAQIRSVQTGSCAAATVTNQAEDYSLSIASGATEKLPFGKVKNKEGNDVQVDYKPAADGYIFQETACPSSSSVSLAASDTTPNIGAKITLTATATGFQVGDDLTYTFTIINNSGTRTDVVQTNDNTYDYTVPFVGTEKIRVTVEDESGNSAVDAVTVVSSWTFDQCIVLDGSTQRIESNDSVARNLISGQSWMISAWVNADTLANNPILFSYDTFWFIQMRSGDVRARTNSTTSGKTYSQAFSPGQWYHILVQRTAFGDNIEVWVNGVQRTTVAGSVGNDTNSTAKMLIGDYLFTPGLKFDGKLDEVIFAPNYNATPAQIAAYSNGGDGNGPLSLIDSCYYTRLPLNGNVDNGGTSGIAFTAINSPTYTAH